MTNLSMINRGRWYGSTVLLRPGLFAELLEDQQGIGEKLIFDPKSDLAEIGQKRGSAEIGSEIWQKRGYTFLDVKLGFAESALYVAGNCPLPTGKFIGKPEARNQSFLVFVL